MLEKTTPKMDAKDYQLIADRVLKILKKNQKEQEINFEGIFLQLQAREIS